MDGVASNDFPIEDQVFQGTVLGPPMWNVFFADVSVPAVRTGATEAIFADDLNTCKTYATRIPNEDILSDMHGRQSAVHVWGLSNQVLFDPAKE